ncbi:cell division topological specificity factor homolog, chloroplastic isoform X2 [Physcomitrium patens]|uniref:Plastid division regulator MinE n=1 Tax=Physcomitrium patens TaxID=3218 RepID=A0A7I4ELJ9_PHYPA|nr:cell division topological specificity factor homolog, chloroplastic-like isoform X2 [Physcomitrium patens]|eukprot:XP_024383915.1 cell division topological specificity factor homolog, chloroplastic-like isoform X2 [Physcomitrella patens]
MCTVDVKGSGHVVPISQCSRVMLQSAQGPSARVHFLRHAHYRNMSRCIAMKSRVENSRADFSTGNEEDEITGGKSQTFMERITRAWSVLFPAKAKPSSNKDVAKQRLKMILISDRCTVNEEAKKKIVTNIVGALSDFVEIQSEEKVQFNVTSDADLNTVCSVTVPVRRVRPQYQEFSRDLVHSELEAFDCEEKEGSFRMVDIRFERPDVEGIDV